MKYFTSEQIRELKGVLEANGLGPCTHPDCDPRQPSCASNAIHLRALAAMKTAYRLGRGLSAYTLEMRRSPMSDYKWKVGDVFTDGKYRWRVDSVEGERAVLRSCGSSWATTIPLTFAEWREGGRWQLEGGPR